MMFLNWHTLVIGIAIWAVLIAAAYLVWKMIVGETIMGAILPVAP